jgi:sugar phosphate isomerase/epimerase
MGNDMTRRGIFQLGAGLAAGVSGAARAATPDSEPVRLGVCSYSLREFQRKLAISMIKQLGVGYVSVKEFHLPYTISADDAAKARSEFKKAGLTIASGGNIALQDEDPAALRRLFEYARLCGMPMMVCAPSHRTLPMVEKLAKEFDIRLAIHNHGPEDKHFPTPQSVLDAVKGLDPRVGLCMDVGHSMRTGIDVVQAVESAGPRLLDMHMKDLKRANDKDSQCAVGEGVMPVVAIFKQLKKINYQGCVNLEYEINSDNPLPGMQRSIGYLKGVAAGLAG